jgi:hypothetical protein
MISEGQMEEARDKLSPILTARTPFRILDRIGEQIGAGPIHPVRAYLRSLAQLGALGGWPVIGSALARQLDRDTRGTLSLCREFIVDAARWFTTDILAERVLGGALALELEANLERLVAWRQDPDRWARRAIGVGIHNWGKKSGGAAALEPQVEAVLGFLEPMFSERETDAVKGIGWGLKTLGRFYPELLSGWLHDQCVIEGRPHRRLMLRKALTYLSAGQRAYALGETL